LLWRLFKLKENQTTVRRELLAGCGTGSGARLRFKLGLTDSGDPIARLTAVVSNCQHEQAVVFDGIDERKWELPKNLFPDAGQYLRSRLRKL